MDLFRGYKQFKLLREGTVNKDKNTDDGVLNAKVTLGDGNEFKPFEVSDDPKSEHYGKNKNLAPIVRAFKGGANWGWSKDDSTGDDKPVKITGKKLFLAGGAVRSHLTGEKARNIELATSASPDEVYHLLKQNGFEFIDDPTMMDQGPKPPHPNKKEGAKQFFWVRRANKNGRPFSFGLRVNEDEFELDVFQKTARGPETDDEDPEPGTHADDANSRDFTINSMYIDLTNENGSNKELRDFHGGAHDLLAKKVKPIGGDVQSFKKHPSRMMRYMRFMNAYGDDKNVSQEDLDKIRATASEAMPKLDRKYMMDEFKKGMDREGGDTRKFLKLLNKFGVLNHIFPGKSLDTELPKDLSDLGDKHAPIAYLLRNNPPEALEDSGMDKKDMNKVLCLVKALGMNEDMDHNSLEDLTTSYMSSGISSRKMRDYMTKVGRKDPMFVDAFLNHVHKSPRVRLYMQGDDGSERLNDAFSDLIDPFTGQQNEQGIQERRKLMELQSFKNQLKFMRPI